MLSCKELYNVTENPKINTISLELLREYYETYLSLYIYNYQIMLPNEGTRDVELRFDQENFCHLLGIESILRKSINKKDLNNFKGLSGWDKIQQGHLDFKFLKTKNKRGFLNNKSRFVFFYLIPRLVETPQGVIFNQRKVMGKTRIDCELLFFDHLQNAYVHIGIKKDDVLGYYIPKTFLIEKITDDNDGLKYVGDQQAISINKVTKYQLKP